MVYKDFVWLDNYRMRKLKAEVRLRGHLETGHVAIKFELSNVKGQELKNVPCVRKQRFTVIPQCLFEKLSDNGLKVLVILGAELDLHNVDGRVIVLHTQNNVKNGLEFLLVRFQLKLANGVQD